MTIVVGYIPTEEGRAALRLAADEAVLRNTRLLVISSHQGGASLSAKDIQSFEDELSEVRTRLDAAGVVNEVRTLIRGNDPSEDLAEVATQEKADFIVIGLRRRSPVGKLLLGSNAQRTLLDAPCPVIAVHASPPN